MFFPFLFVVVVVVQKTTGAQDPFGQFPVCRHGNEKSQGWMGGKKTSHAHQKDGSGDLAPCQKYKMQKKNLMSNLC